MHPDTATYNSGLEPADREIADLLARTIDTHLTGAENKIWHRHPVWFLNGNPIVGYSKLKGCMRLLFWSGQSFDEPGLTPEGTFKAAEARYKGVADVDPADLVRWLATARRVQWNYKDLVKKKGRLELLDV